MNRTASNDFGLVRFKCSLAVAPTPAFEATAHVVPIAMSRMPLELSAPPASQSRTIERSVLSVLTSAPQFVRGTNRKRLIRWDGIPIISAQGISR